MENNLVPTHRTGLRLATGPAALATLATLVTLGGCAEWVYDMRQASALQSCDKLVLSSEQQDCRKRNGRSYADYEKVRDQQGRRDPAGGAAKADALCFKRASSGETVCPN
jgi:hypothetical protein